jgi:hypothetical protein
MIETGKMQQDTEKPYIITSTSQAAKKSEKYIPFT